MYSCETSKIIKLNCQTRRLRIITEGQEGIGSR